MKIPRGVGTSDPRSELSTSYKTAGREDVVGNYMGLPLRGVGTSNPLFSAGRGPFVGRSMALPMGSELPTPTEFSGLRARVCLVTFIGLLASILDTLASPDYVSRSS